MGSEPRGALMPGPGPQVSARVFRTILSKTIFVSRQSRRVLKGKVQEVGAGCMQEKQVPGPSVVCGPDPEQTCWPLGPLFSHMVRPCLPGKSGPSRSRPVVCSSPGEQVFGAGSARAWSRLTLRPGWQSVSPSVLSGTAGPHPTLGGRCAHHPCSAHGQTEPQVK